MLTISGVQKLFDAGATIVILACNTASAWTLRKLQTEIFPGKRILGVTIPGAEKVIELGLQQVTVFATEQTVKSRTYAERVRILDPDTTVREIAFPGDLVRGIEELLPVQHCRSEAEFDTLYALYGTDGWGVGAVGDDLVRTYFDTFRDRMDPAEAIVLGCTHYSYLMRPLRKLFPGTIFIDPSEEAAEKL